MSLHRTQPLSVQYSIRLQILRVLVLSEVMCRRLPKSARFDHSIAKTILDEKQPRQPLNKSTRCALPHADPLRQQQSLLFQTLPLECRLLIWEYVLLQPYTRIERWRPSRRWLPAKVRYANCFPYRLTTSTAAMAKNEGQKTEKPLKLLLCCRQLYVYFELARWESFELKSESLCL